MTEPSEPLGLTVHSLPQPRDALTRQRASGRLKMLGVLLVCAAPVIASYFLYYVARPSGSGTAYSALIQPTVAMPAVASRTLQGAEQPLRSLAGQWLLVVVDSGACNTACERRLFMQRQLREMTGRERDRIDKLWLVIDDAPPSPVLLQALQATPAMNVLRLPRDVVAAWLKPAPGQALEDHLYIVDPLGEWMMRAPVDADPSKLKRDIDRLMRGSAGWDKPGRQGLLGESTLPALPTVPAAAAGSAPARP
ncbi:MAG: hypothetical protein A3E25_12950 [Burkholderiales bacterium RIFCSPHIGHO2_12_FULL_69_20]|nr:MAG: hypothetical protein A3E25_12950 [Burkholderiales bacterium RIFCSPHIGHO2_12_FULL_69_20]